MRGVSLLRWLKVGLLVCTALCAALTGAAEAPVFVPVAHSAVLTLQAARTPAGATLRLEPAAGHPLPAVSELSVSVDGRAMPATARSDGTWSVSWPAGAAPRQGRLEVVVAHDGIREVLSGVLPAAPGGGTAAASGASSSKHKQLAWWILNFAIVLVAAIAISRRMG
jgi:hypothetical protein